MKFYFLTLFPEIIQAYFNESILKRAQEKDLIKLEIINIRDFSKDKHRRVDDYPYGGGAGMLMSIQPIVDSLKSIPNYKNELVIFPSPSGEVFNQEMAQNLKNQQKDLIFLCGRYEGIDQRVIKAYVDKEISIGDYILTGGELASLVISDAVSRLVPGVLGNQNSIIEESFSDFLLEYPQYTRPEEFENLFVPEILLSGHHEKIKQWRLEKSIEKTKEIRPDLYSKYLAETGGENGPENSKN